MMNQPDQRFDINTRVKLRDGVDPSLYNGFSRVGNEGWIRKRRRDKYGYPQVFIQWDKDHWAYNSQEDGWTWEGQFEEVKDNKMNDNNQSKNLENQIRDITENFVSAIFSTLGQEKKSDSSPEAVIEDDAANIDDTPWEELSSEAIASLAKSRGYLLISLEDAEAENAPEMMIPRIFQACREPDYALIIQSQLSHYLASSQDHLISKILSSKTKGKSNE